MDMLKIDKSFVDHLGIGRDESSMAKVIVQIGQTLQLEVVAEGVERQEQVESLQAIGCDSIQGFHLGSPLSAIDAVDLAASAGPQPSIDPNAHRAMPAALRLIKP